MLATGIDGVPWLQPDQETKLEQPKGKMQNTKRHANALEAKTHKKMMLAPRFVARTTDINRHSSTLSRSRHQRELCGALLQASLMQGGQFCRW